MTKYIKNQNLVKPLIILPTHVTYHCPESVAYPESLKNKVTIMKDDTC